MHGPAILAMVAAVTIYGTNFVVSRHATQTGLDPFELTALRFGVAGALLLPVFLVRGWRGCGGVGWRRGALLAVMSGAPMVTLMNLGLSLAPAAHGAAIQPGIVTCFGAVGGALLAGARPRPGVLAGLAVVLGGLLLIGLAGASGAKPGVALGDLCFVAAGLLWGCYPLVLKRWDLDPLGATAAVSVLSLAYLPFYAALSPGFAAPMAWPVLAVHALNQGVLNVVLGLWLWAYGVRHLGPVIAGRFPPLIPVIGTLLAAPVLGEVPGPLQGGGIALIVAGLVVMTFAARPPRARASTPR